LALDSPAKVARTLADSPAGVDFTAPTTAPAIVETCPRWLELCGEAGDIFLVHPLMLHSASPNPSARIRWLGNPMMYVTDRIDHLRDEPSPVERSIAEALAAPSLER
jgi:hypothetical protein